MTSPEGLHSLFIIKKCLIQNSKIKVHQNLLKYMQINWIDIMNENDKNCQLKTNFQGCFSKKNAHFFDVWSKRKLPFRNANFFARSLLLLWCTILLTCSTARKQQSKGYKECILLYFGNVGHPPPREVARLSKMCISSLENSAAPCFTFEWL